MFEKVSAHVHMPQCICVIACTHTQVIFVMSKVMQVLQIVSENTLFFTMSKCTNENQMCDSIVYN